LAQAICSSARGIELLGIELRCLVMHVTLVACIFISFFNFAACESLRSLKFLRKKESCVPSEATTESALEICGQTKLALKTVQLIKTCAEESIDNIAKIYVSKNKQFLRWDDVCTDTSCSTVSFCADKVTEVTEEETGTGRVKSHYAVNVLTYEIARWLFLGEVAVDKENIQKFEVEESEVKLSEINCGEWKTSIVKPKNGGTRSFEDRKKEKDKNYKILIKKLNAMEEVLSACEDDLSSEKNNAEKNVFEASEETCVELDDLALEDAVQYEACCTTFPEKCPEKETGVTIETVQDEQLTEEQLQEKQLQEKQLQEKQLQEKQLQEKQLQEKQLTEEEKQLTEEQLKEKQIKEEPLAEKQLTEEQLAEKQLTEEQLAEKQLTEEQLAEKQKQLTEEQLKEKQLTEEQQQKEEQQLQEKQQKLNEEQSKDTQNEGE